MIDQPLALLLKSRQEYYINSLSGWFLWIHREERRRVKKRRIKILKTVFDARIQINRQWGCKGSKRPKILDTFAAIWYVWFGSFLKSRWERLLLILSDRFGEEPDLSGSVFWSVCRNLVRVHRNIARMKKQDLMHIATCKLLSVNLDIIHLLAPMKTVGPTGN